MRSLFDFTKLQSPAIAMQCCNYQHINIRAIIANYFHSNRFIPTGTLLKNNLFEMPFIWHLITWNDLLCLMIERFVSKQQQSRKKNAFILKRPKQATRDPNKNKQTQNASRLNDPTQFQENDLIIQLRRLVLSTL